MATEHAFMFKHIDPRRSPGENARRNRAELQTSIAVGWRVRHENADRWYVERTEQDLKRALLASRLARKPKPKRPM